MKIISWNLEGRLSRLASDERGTPEKIVAAIRSLNADVLVHPEAFGSDPGIDESIEKTLGDLGYESVSVAYDDLIGRGEKAVVPNPHMRVMSRLPITASEVIRPGNLRSMLAIHVADPVIGTVRIIGVHLDDRDEELRLRQAGPLIEYINGSRLPTIVCGDFNAMPPHAFRSTVVHNSFLRDLASLVPHRHMRYTLTRLSDMASGTTIDRILGETDLVNTDPRLTPTTTPKMRRMEWMPSIPLVKIDWILVSKDLAYRDFAVSPDLGSDHRALSVSVLPANGAVFPAKG